jgi:cobalt/nickel transport system permease protein
MGFIFELGCFLLHIPDGYLSPATTLPAVAGMIPAWGVAFRKVKKTFSKKQIPTLALCSAFSFLIMMFNVPVAGGSSAHAVGAVFIAILLGPWAAVISVSTALLIQALVFGDGGIMAYGINCLNMALAMPFAGYGVYKLIKGKSEPGTRRGLTAAFFGSYFGLNLAALLTAVEFGIQPLLFRAADGTPLYCPYPLSASVPSMMAAHILVAGPIEGAVTVAAVAYLYHVVPQLFAARKPEGAGAKLSWFQRYRPAVLPFAALIVLTPLGLLATGTAWGEWSMEEIKEQLGYIPQGITAAADWWNSLLPDYTVPALGESRLGAAAGYVLCAAIGVLLIATLIFLTSKMVVKKQDKKEN